MPTYELTCRACGHRFERFVMRILRDGESPCPVCGSIEVVKGVGGGVVAGLSSASAQPAAGCGTGRFS